jgi:hypothetical protein
VSWLDHQGLLTTKVQSRGPQTEHSESHTRGGLAQQLAKLWFTVLCGSGEGQQHDPSAGQSQLHCVTCVTTRIDAHIVRVILSAATSLDGLRQGDVGEKVTVKATDLYTNDYLP